MGLAHLTIEIANPSNLHVTEKVELLVDSGAVYSVVPRNILERLGIQPHAEQRFRLADGSRILRERGIAGFKYGERIVGVRTWFLANPATACCLEHSPLKPLAWHWTHSAGNSWRSR